MTPTDIAELRRLLAAATPGPWEPCEANDGKCPCGLIWSKSADVVVAHTCKPEDDISAPSEVNDNTRLIVALRNAAPLLLEELDRLRKACAAVYTDTGWCSACDGHEHHEDCPLRGEERQAKDRDGR